MLISAGLSKERDVFITNLVKCNSKDEYGRNRPPNKKEIENCHLFLQEEIELLKPKLIIPFEVGTFPSKGTSFDVTSG